MKTMFGQFVSSLLLARTWTGWRYWVALLLGCGIIILLGVFRIQTQASFAVTSLVILPILVVTWMGNGNAGLLMAVTATGMWAVTDVSTTSQSNTAWIHWINALTRLSVYSLVVLITAFIRQRFEAIHNLATHDALTGLQNRRGFLDSGAAEAERSRRYSRPLAVVFIDLDNFKQLNDTKGHHAGDHALKAVANALKNGVRSTDQVARLGGDEFAALLPEIGYHEAIQTVNKVFGEMNHALNAFPPVATSVGVIWFEVAERAFPQMLQAADELMYEVKASGKGNVRSRAVGMNKRAI